MKQKIIFSILSLLIAILLFLVPNPKISGIDDPTETYFNESIKKATLAYATTRMINATISVIKDSELQVEPGGVGMSIAIGEVVDPIDDMTERLSSMLVTAIVSLGIQKIVFEICNVISPIILYLTLFISSILIWTKLPFIKLQRFIIKTFLLVAIIRLFLPMAAYINTHVYEEFFSERIELAQGKLNLVSEELNDLQKIELPEVDGIRKTIENSSQFLKNKTEELKNTLRIISHNVSSIIDNLLELTWIYTSIFLLQVILFPIASFVAMTRLSKYLLSEELQSIFKK